MHQYDVTALLDEAVDKYPNHEAITDGQTSVTFFELRNYAIRRARWISERIKSSMQRPIAICMEDGLECLVCIWGVLYSGNFFCLINPRYPGNYIRGMLDVLHPSIILTDTEYKDVIKPLCGRERCVIFEELLENDWNGERKDRLSNKRKFTDIAEVLFTSGSTGKPKGVMTTHGGLVNAVMANKEYFELHNSDTLAMLFPFTSRAALPYICLALFGGNKVLIIPVKQRQKLDKVACLFKQQKTTIVFCPTGWMRMAGEYGVLKYEGFQGIRRIIAAGETMRKTTVVEWMDAVEGIRIYNAYGTTETTGCFIYYEIAQDSLVDDIPIGIPLTNIKIYILDETGHKVAEGDIGEMYVGGKLLAAGYYDDVQKTKEKFIENPINGVESEVLYRTGDLVFIDENGILHYVGRKDHQIQHHGYRVELDEVEICVAEVIENMGEVGCIYDKEREQIICFYRGGLEEMELYKKVHDILPQYMVPGIFMRLEKFPYNRNGKIDRIKLEELWRKGKQLSNV